jgi:hypothetical protein
MVKILGWYLLCLLVYVLIPLFFDDGINLIIKTAIVSLVGALLFKAKNHLAGMLFISVVPVSNFLIHEIAINSLDAKMLMWELFLMNMLFYQIFAALVWPVFWLREKLFPSKGKEF